MSSPSSQDVLNTQIDFPKSTRISYTAWNEAIANHFFNPSKNGQPVYLQVDLDAIQLIGQQLGLQPEEAETSFIQAVNQYIFATTPPATNIIVSAKYMTRNEQHPEFIAFLAFCVLAASRMERDNEHGVSAANYYIRLNEMLRLDRVGRPSWFADTITAWQKLKEWLHEVHQGCYGIATAQPLNPVHPYVGYPQSQCLLRAADRQHLSTFFRWARLQPGDMPSSEWLSAMLREWANSSRCPLSSPAQRRITQGLADVQEALLTIIALELQAWDGSSINESNSVKRTEQSVLRMTIHSAAREVSWYDYQAEALLPIPGVPPLFSHVPTTPSEAVIVFGNHPDAGQWTLIPRATLGAEHVLLVHESQISAVREFLKQAALPTWQERTFRGIPPGWHCFRGVELVRVIPRLPWDSLQLHDNVTVRFEGGLILERNMYMVGFEPNLVIDGPGSVDSILLDQQPLPAHTGGRTVISLAQYCLQPGYHVINVGSRTRSFVTRNPHRPVITTQAVPQIAYPLRRVVHGYFPESTSQTIVDSQSIQPGTIYVSGSIIYGHSEDLPELLPYTILAPDGFKNYIILGRHPGEIYEYRNTLVVRKEQQAIRQRSLSFDVPFEPQWLIKAGRRKTYLSALQLYVQPPTYTPTDKHVQLESWIYTVVRKSYIKRLNPEQTAIWQLYASAGARLKAVR